MGSISQPLNRANSCVKSVMYMKISRAGNEKRKKPLMLKIDSYQAPVFALIIIENSKGTKKRGMDR